MATRRRIGVSIATTEAARRQLMQPVPCWEKKWLPLPDAPAGATLKIYKWVKTDAKQSFSDDEEEPDMPLQPLPEIEQEGNEGDDDIDPDTSVAPDSASRAVSEPVSAPPEAEDSTPAPTVPKPHPLSMSMVPGEETETPETGMEGIALDSKDLEEGAEGIDSTIVAALDANSLDATTAAGALDSGLDVSMDAGLVGEPLGDDDGGDGMALQVPGLDGDIDLTQLGPDGEPFEASGDLAQLQSTDSLLGGDAMDESVDPFSAPAPT